MGYRRTRAAAVRRMLSVCGLLAPLAGCALLPPFSLLNPTNVGGWKFTKEPHQMGIRRRLSPHETPAGIASATEPAPEDLVPVFSDYRVGPGDILVLTIADLLEGGRPYIATVQVTAIGEIRVPEIGTLRVAGLTEGEIEQELVAQLKTKAILPNPSVIAQVQQARGRTFSVIGAVRSPGMYPITDPTLKFSDALAMVGDAEPTIKKAYIIRREGPWPLPGLQAPGGPVVPTAPPAGNAPSERYPIPPPTEDLSPPPPVPSMSSGNAAQEPPVPTREELRDALTGQTQSQPASQGTPPLELTNPPIIFDPETGKKLTPPAPPAQREVPPGQAPPVAPTPPAVPPEMGKPFDWESPETPQAEQRVIEIDLVAVRSGNVSQDVYIRDRDVISLLPDTGVFYIMGEVMRPGVYAFGGRQISVKQAMAIVGGFTQLAWPARAELIRKEPGTDRQTTRSVNLDAIFYGLEEDFYLKDEDILNVGTDVVAPFLFVLRNSFRFTYGFGFVYDRNFADKDAYNAQVNPVDLQRAQRQSRGLPF